MKIPTRIWPAVLVVAAAALIWVAHYERWTPASWQLPTDYYVDAQETLARLKAASEGDLVPLRPQVIDRLGAPFGAYWNAYPTPDKPLMLALGALVHAVGLYAAANLGLLLAQVSSALAFFLVARSLRCRWEWAAAGALLFACTYSTVHRGLSHFSLVFTWTIPLGLWAVWLIAGSRRLEWSRAGAAGCIGAAVALGTSNPYNLLFWLQLMGWAVVVQWLGPRRRANLQIGVASMAVALLALFIVQAEGWLYVEDTEALPLLARNYAGTEMYALKPVELFIPPAYHGWDWMAFFGHRYLRWSGWRGEAFLPYLGLVGVAGFVWLLFVTVRRIVDRRPLPGQALSVGWILAYASVGGVTNLLALYAGFQVFRATNRGAIFISALVLFFFVLRLSRLSVNWPAWMRAGAATLVGGVGVWEQLPRRDAASDRQTLAAEVQADREFGRRLEAVLPAGARVFQLPVLGFPEVATPYQLGDYEHFRPYLASETLCFSYGAAKARARGLWQQELAARPVPEMVRRLEDYGFAALYINRKGYADRAESLLRDLAALEYPLPLEGLNGDQVVVRLRPVADPRPPLSDAMTLGRGWHQRADGGVRWAYGSAALSYYNPYAKPIRVDVRLTLLGITSRRVALEHEGKVVGEFTVTREPAPFEIARVELAPGVNRFALQTAAKARRDPAAQNQLRSFGVLDVTVVPSALDPVTPAARVPETRPGVVGTGGAPRVVKAGG